MPNLQYIGARYVPKFYENSLDPSLCTWESGVSYEPLTVVTYNDDSYTSKKLVPSNIGNPAANPTYWAKTGDFNASLVALQNTVNNIDNIKIPALDGRLGTLENTTIPAIQTNVSRLMNKKVIFIGDSYLTQAKWGNKIAAIMGWTLNSDYWQAAVGGEGFTQPSGANGFLNRLSGLSIANPDDITDIIVCGGFNDAKTANNYAIATGISNFVTYAKTHYPNAKVHVGFIGAMRVGGSAVGSVTPTTMEFALYQYYKCTRAGATYLSGVEYCLRQQDNQLESDGVHPTDEAGKDIADAIINAWLQGYADSNWIVRGINFTNDIAGDSRTKSMYMYHHGRDFRFAALSTVEMDVSGGTTIAGSSNPTTIAHQSEFFFNRRYDVMCAGLVRSGSTNEIRPIMVSMEGYELKVSIPNAPSGSWLSNSVDKLYIFPFSIIGSTLDLS
jgi:hypothetical protein